MLFLSDPAISSHLSDSIKKGVWLDTIVISCWQGHFTSKCVRQCVLADAKFGFKTFYLSYSFLMANFAKPMKFFFLAVLRCPETLSISHENANFLFSVVRVVQGEAKTPKIMGCLQGKFCIFTCLKIGTFRGKWTLEWVIKTSHFVLLALYFLSTSKLAFSLIASQRCLARTAKKVWVRAQNSAKNNFLPLRLETYLAWTFLFPCSFLNNYPWTSEKNSFFNKLWV